MEDARQKKLRARGRALLVVFVFVLVSITLASQSPEDIVALIGNTNAYLLMGIFGVIGGLTTFTGIPYHIFLASFAAGGLNPLLLGLCTAMGVMLGDSTMFFLSKKVAPALPEHVLHVTERIGAFFSAHPHLLAPALFLYGALTPFSNDWIVGSLSVSGYSFRRIMIPLTLGNIVFNIGIAYAGIYAYDAILTLF